MPITQTIKRTVTFGRVSHPKRFGAWKGVGPFPLVQADISLAKGSSGGGMYNAKGQLVGMNTFILDAAVSLSSGFSFALRAPDIKRITDHIIKTGYGPWKRRFGASVKECTTAMAKAHKQAGPVGVILNSVAEGGLAERLGLKAGDLVLKVGEVAVACPSSLAYALILAEGQKTTVKVSRIGTGEVDLPLNLRNRGKYRKLKTKDNLFDTFGFKFSEVKGNGVYIDAVRPGSLAAVEGFLGDELILAVQDTETGKWLETNSVTELNRILRKQAKNGVVLKVDDCDTEVLMAISA
jgi:serine protease Do